MDKNGELTPSAIQYALMLISLMIKGTTGAYVHRMDHDLSDSHESTASEAAAVQVPSTINERALVRKIDLRLLPVLFVIYVAAFLDR